MQKEVKRLLVSGIILWFAGAASFFWVFSEKEKQQQHLSQQHELYNAKLVEINQLTNTQKEIDPFKGIISEAISSEKPENIAQSSNGEMVSYFSISCMALGTLIFLSLLLLWLVHFILEKISNFKKNLAQSRKKQKKTGDLLIESDSQKMEETVKLAQKLYEPFEFDPNFSCTDQRKFLPSKGKVEKPINYIKPDHDDKFFADKSDFQIKPIDHLEDKIHDVVLSSYQENAGFI